MKKDEFIAKYGEDAYELWKQQIRKWRKEHKEQCKLLNRKWYEEHKEHHNQLNKNQREEHKEQHNELNSYKSHSRHIFSRMFPTLDLSEYNVHHCFGPSSDNFVVLLKKDHLNLHKKFGKTNSDCLYSNPEVKNFILCVPHLIVLNKMITENTLEI